MASFLDVCRFNPTAGGTTDWTYSSAVTGYQSPAAAGAVNGALYRYRAESADLTQWEIGFGVENTGTGVLTRATVLFNSAGTTAKINFTLAPQVAIIALAEDVGGWTNRRLSKTAAYTIAQADAGNTIALSGNAYYALTFPAASGFDANHVSKVTNEDTGRGKLLLPVYTTSSTSLAIATGSKAFTVASGLFVPNSKRWRAYSLANNANFMSGTASYSGTTLTLTVDTIGGSGTFTDWQITPEIILWPLQTCTVFNNNSSWIIDPVEQPWMPETTPTINVDPTGSDANDGLGTTTGALKTLAAATVLAYKSIYTRNVASINIDGGSNTLQEFVQVFYPLNGGGVLIFQNFTWKPANSGYCLQFGDNALVGITNIAVSTAGTTTPAGIFVGHQQGVMDVNAGFSVTPTVTLSGDVFTTDGLTHFNINNGLTLNAGTISGMIYRTVWAAAASNGQSTFNIQGAHTYVGSPTIGRFAWSTLNSVITLASTVTHTGTVTSSVSLVNQNGTIQNLGAALPGGAPTPTTGGQYNTTTTA